MPLKVGVLFGGAGYIGSFLVDRFRAMQTFDRIVVVDIRPPVSKKPGVDFLHGDVRSPIEIDLPADLDPAGSWVFNLAAVHREPGHAAHEYFDTNVNGARNVNRFLERSGIANLFFTSSIAPYGRSREVRDESSACYPETPYGISKWQAEAIHELWQKAARNRRLVICRPSVIYGPGDPGNVLRMIRGIQRGTFFIPGDPGIVKSHGYIYGFLDSVAFTMAQKDPYILYNYAENPCPPLGEMVAAVKRVLGIRRPVFRVPLPLLIAVARLISLVYPSGPVHPVRVRKAAFPTNVEPRYLIDHGFNFAYGFARSLEHWRTEAPEDFS